jgi:bla regulator protein BlaR1
MKRLLYFLSIFLVLVPAAAFAGDDIFTGPFGETQGCFTLYDMTDNSYRRYNPERCSERLTPCSTFKIPNSLIALQTGVLRDEKSSMKWDGTAMFIREWEHDQTLKSALQCSCVWYFQRAAEKIGAERMQRYLDRIGYGNRDISGGISRFWIQSTLLISADEQVDFLARLYRNQLPFGAPVTGIVQKLLVYNQGREFRFSGKTGSAYKEGRWVLGWYVGHVKKGNQEYVCACNIQGDDGCSGSRARDITIEVLKKAGLWVN